MIECPKCNKQLDDEAKFCDGCGAQVEGCGDQVFETVFCPNCGAQTSTEFAFCQSCGTAIAEDAPAPAPATENQEKKAPKKAVLFAGIGVAVIVVIAAIILLFGGSGGSSTANYTMYVKDKEVFYNNFSKKGSQQITSSLFSSYDLDNDEIASASYYLGNYFYLSSDGKRMFFPDKFSEYDDAPALYYKNINKSNEEAVKIDSDVFSYCLNAEETVVTYLKGYDGNLYQYDIKKDEKEKIDSEVEAYYVSDDGKKIVYSDSEGNIYLKYSGKDKEKIDSDTYGFSYVSEDLKTLIYLKDSALYIKEDGKEKVKIASDIYTVLKIYDSGRVYYLKSESSQLTLADYVQDDLKDSDAAMTYPVSPDYPYWWYYDSDAEYEAAWAAYEAAYAEYEVAYEEYWAKVNRDSLRESLAEATMSQSDYTLCYFDGKEEKVLTDAFSYFSSYSFASNTPVMVYRAYNQSEFNKIKISEIDSIYDVEEMVQAALYSSSTAYVAVGDASTAIDQDTDGVIRISPDGKTIYFVESNVDKDYGDMYKITVSGGKIEKTELYDSDVYYGGMRFLSNDKLLYFKDYKDGKGEMYINKSKIDFDVNIYYNIDYYENLDKLVYYTDWNSDKSYGILKTYENGKTNKIADDVHSAVVLPNGNILYLYDYSINSYKGDLYLYKNGNAEKIDMDVVGIISNADGRYRGINIYGW